MPAGYTASTQMESVFSKGFTFSAELSDLRVIERPLGVSRPPSNIVKQGDDFDLYTDIHFVGDPGVVLPPMPPVDIYVKYALEGHGGDTAEEQTNLVRVQSSVTIPPYSYPLQLAMPADVIDALAAAAPGTYKITANIYVVWEGREPVSEAIMRGFIEGAPLFITPANPTVVQ